MENAISYIKDVVLVELKEISKCLVEDLDNSIANVEQELKVLEIKKKETFLFIKGGLI